MRIPALAVAAILSTLTAWPAGAQNFRLKIACTPTSDCLSALIAHDEGLFAARGIEAEFVLMQNQIPAALVSDSIQIGGPTIPVFLQAVDGGLDLVAVAGAGVMDPVSNSYVAAIGKKGEDLKAPKDFVGKKVGAPGLGALLHVMFRKWLIDGGVDPSKVNFVEVSFQNMNDALKTGSLDAVLTTEPFASRILSAGTGEVAAHYLSDLARSEPIIAYLATRAFADAHPEVIKHFRAAIEAAAPIVNADRDKANAALSRFNKVPFEILKANRPDIAAPALKRADLKWWVATLKQQDMLQTDIDLDRIVAP